MVATLDVAAQDVVVTEAIVGMAEGVAMVVVRTAGAMTGVKGQLAHGRARLRKSSIGRCEHARNYTERRES